MRGPAKYWLKKYGSPYQLCLPRNVQKKNKATPSVDNILQLCTTSSVPTQRSMGGLLGVDGGMWNGWDSMTDSCGFRGWFKIYWNLSHYQFGWIQMNGNMSYKLWTTNNWWNSSCSNSCDCGIIEIRCDDLAIHGIPWGAFVFGGEHPKSCEQFPWNRKNKLAMPWVIKVAEWIHILMGWFQVHYL